MFEGVLTHPTTEFGTVRIGRSHLMSMDPYQYKMRRHDRTRIETIQQARVYDKYQAHKYCVSSQWVHPSEQTGNSTQHIQGDIINELHTTPELSTTTPKRRKVVVAKINLYPMTKAPTASSLYSTLYD